MAFSSVHLSRRTQLDKLLDLLMASDNTYATHIRSINAKVPVQLPDVDAMGDISGTRTRRGGAFVLPIFRGRGQAGWSGAGPSTDRQGADDAIETQGALFQKLVTASTNLKTLSLTVLGHAFSVRPPLLTSLSATDVFSLQQSPFGGRHAGADFLDPVILATLSSIPTLRTLTLGTSIDFEELEVIMLGLPLLEELRLDGGFDSIDGRGAVSSTSPHLARLRKLTVGDGQQVPRDFSSVSDVQLAWLLEPAARSLHVLDITVMSMNPNAGFGAGGWGGGGGGGAQAPPFASGLFADMLVLMGPTLERLAIKDAQGGGAVRSFSYLSTARADSVSRSSTLRSITPRTTEPSTTPSPSAPRSTTSSSNSSIPVQLSSTPSAPPPLSNPSSSSAHPPERVRENWRAGSREEISLGNCRGSLLVGSLGGAECWVGVGGWGPM